MRTYCVPQGAQLGGDLDGWDGGGLGGKSKREATHVSAQLIHLAEE